MNKKYLFLILLVILVGTVSAEPLDICAGPTKVLYIVHDDCPEQSAAYSAYLEQTLVDMGFEVDLIGNNFLDEVDFDEYAFMLLDDHFYENYDEIPVNDFPAVILNSHNMEDWNWVNYISTYTMNINLRIENIDDDHIVMEDISQFPTVYDAYIYNDGYNTYLPVYYLSRFVKAPGLHTLATTYTPAYLLDNGDATLALAEPGDQLLNGDVSNVRSCWFGFTEKDYWTNAAETMFEQCVAWVSLGGDADEDGVRDDCDNCPYNYNPDQSDIDGDKVGDVCDNCPSTSNTDQEDNDEDGIGNVCDICPDDSGNDADQDGFCYPDDCVDTDDTIYPGADETVCNGIDNDCDIDLDEDYEEVSCGQGECSGMTSCEFGEILCRDNGADQAGSDCGGCCLCEDNNDPKETYDETQDLDCSDFNLAEIATCTNDPDNNPMTWDSAEGFVSECSAINTCTQGTYDYTHTCDTDQCGAQCEIDGDCESYCEADVYYDAGTCDNACGCEYESEDCSQYDGWYDTGELQWVNTDQCNEKEQYEQEYRDYTCGIGGCDYTVTDHQWLDSGSTRYEEAGTTCDDGLFCTVGDVCTLGVCGGETRDCSAEDDQCNLGVCDEQSDVCLPEPVADGTACNDNLYCNVGETCQSGVCTGGLLRDCSGNDIPGVDQCDYSPDDIDFTRDTYEGFTSVCSEELDICTEGEEQITSECDLTCGAECEADGDCESYCEADVYYDAGTCDNACGCEYESEDCSQYDGWYDTGELQWVNTDQCNEKEQYEQEYRDYTCGIGGCDYTVTDHQWLDTGNNQYEEDGTVCDDGLYCTENDICTAGVCGGETVDCSANDISGVNTCFNDPDDIDFTYDTRESFTSVCVEEAQGYICTTGDETVASECDIDQCGAECEADNDCGSYCEADLFYGATGCSDACGCEYDEPLDCNGLDGFYYPGEERWVNHPEDQCKLMKQVIRETRDYTCDAANESGCSYVVTDTRWVDRPSFVENKDDGTSCDADELYCTVNDVCMEGVCEPGDAPDCTANDISEVDTCFNDPDGIDFTYDTRESFTSVCVEDTEGYVCTTGDETVTSECDTDQCGAQCEIDGDCESYCEADVYYDAGTCDNACGCEYESEDCSQYDGWYDTGELQWVNTDQCNEKEQYEQEYRDYTCGIGGCDYTVTDRQWLDTGVQNNEPDGTICEDGLYCTENDVCTSGVCGGQIVDCSANDITEVGTCTNDPDGNPVTWDSRASFTSVCVEEAEGYTCTEGDPSVDSECDKDTCGAQCEVDAHCGDFCADGVFHSAGTCSDACGCVYETEDCNSYDGWYESVQTRWVEDEICTEKEQAKREYRDYSCGFDGCIYEITDEDWIDTGETRNKPQGTTCDDGLFCTVSDICSEGVCGGSPRDCSAGGDQCNTGVCDENLDLCIGEPVPDGTACDDGLYCNVEETCQSGLCQGGQERDCSANDLDPVDQCNYEPDGIDVTRDTFEGFISECVEEDDSCTVGNELITSYCDLTCGAECADGNQDNTDGCLNTCVKAGCGDGYVWEGKEECDDANTDNTDACLNKCVLPTCGDGYVWEGVEECDDGALNGEPLHCSLDCDGITDPVCGNEVLEQGEECDDGNLDSNDGCSSQCIVEFCGDNIVQPGIGEECEFDSQCDDQDYRTEDVCSSSCGCENNIICEDECLPSEADVCMAEEIWECRNDFDTDPCYEWGPKFDCSTLDSCHVYQLEEPICLSCGTDCCIYEGIEYREYSCLGGDCAYTVLPLIDADSDMKDDRCDDCVDLDNDGICDHEDTCPGVYNPTNVDSDNDGVGNACDNDRDNDGYDAGDDCNDWDPEINPGMPEIQGDGKDNDCDPETPDREQKIRSQDLQLGTKILNEDTALEDDELMVAVYVRNRGSKTVKDLKIKGILLDEYISDYTTMPTLKDGDTNRVILYIPFDGRIMPDAYYLRTTLYVENVKKSKYSQVLIH